MRNPVILAFSTHIRRLRDERNISQEELALEADISRRTILRIEKGTHNPSLVILVSLAKALKISLMELMDFHIPE